MKTSEPTYFSYISYVTIREAWEVTKLQFSIWVFLSIFFLVVGWLGLVGVGAAKSWFGDDIPTWVWWAIGWCCLTWVMRGEVVKIPFPKLTFGQWLLFSAAVFLFGWIFTVLPWWASSPFWLLLIVIGGALDELVAKGKENFAKLQTSTSDEAVQAGWDS